MVIGRDNGKMKSNKAAERRLKALNGALEQDENKDVEITEIKPQEDGRVLMSYNITKDVVADAEFMVIEHNDIDKLTVVADENIRNPDGLTPGSVADILPDIIENGIRELSVGIMRDGIIHVTNGSRRRFCAKTAKCPYPIIVILSAVESEQLVSISETAQEVRPHSSRELGISYYKAMKRNNLKSFGQLLKLRNVPKNKTRTLQRHMQAARVSQHLLKNIADYETISFERYFELSELQKTITEPEKSKLYAISRTDDLDGYLVIADELVNNCLIEHLSEVIIPERHEFTQSFKNRMNEVILNFNLISRGELIKVVQDFAKDKKGIDFGHMPNVRRYIANLFISETEAYDDVELDPAIESKLSNSDKDDAEHTTQENYESSEVRKMVESFENSLRYNVIGLTEAFNRDVFSIYGRLHRKLKTRDDPKVTPPRKVKTVNDVVFKKDETLITKSHEEGNDDAFVISFEKLNEKQLLAVDEFLVHLQKISDN
ncbi:hypothetical protein [Vibrio barjaei]|uniref:hypothetical protein n=1 Tax=Vibrio barjaei TaxID=1676683 RepID=UPI0022840274|nr:hypothetical protein [Vibrio barjaei]MCY9872938.1 hypothetical protein [Vibrio barjaei]